MELHTIPRRKTRKMKAKRLGRGIGSGVGGHTVGRGQKGQKSRTGHKSTMFFEGGNVPFYRRMPKYRGFNRPGKIKHEAINVSLVDEEYKPGETVSLESLIEKGLIRKRNPHVKILGDGEIKKKVTIDGLTLSATAEKKIIAAGGTIK